MFIFLFPSHVIKKGRRHLLQFSSNGQIFGEDTFTTTDYLMYQVLGSTLPVQNLFYCDHKKTVTPNITFFLLLKRVSDSEPAEDELIHIPLRRDQTSCEAALQQSLPAAVLEDSIISRNEEQLYNDIRNENDRSLFAGTERRGNSNRTRKKCYI